MGSLILDGGSPILVEGVAYPVCDVAQRISEPPTEGSMILDSELLSCRRQGRHGGSLTLARRSLCATLHKGGHGFRAQRTCSPTDL